MKKEPIVLDGQPVGRLRASWILFKESYRFFKSDPEMIWIPLITSLLNIFFFGILVVAFVFVVVASGSVDAEGVNSDVVNYSFIFFCYVIGAFTFALSQAGIVHIVYTRIHGGDATLGQGLKAAFSHWGSLLVWSLITSTVGIILRIIMDRSESLGKIVAALIGVGWNVLTYFVIPAMVIDKVSAFASIGKSGRVFKTTWGETLVSNISLGLVFFIVHVLAILSLIGLVITAVALEIPLLVLAAFGLYIIFLLVAGLLQSALAGVLKTLLYVYASEGTVPQNFNQELLQKMLSRKDGETPQQPASQSATGGVEPGVSNTNHQI